MPRKYIKKQNRTSSFLPQTSSSQNPPKSISNQKRETQEILMNNISKRFISRNLSKYVYLFSENYADIEKLLNARGHSLRVGPNTQEFRILKSDPFEKTSPVKFNSNENC